MNKCDKMLDLYISELMPPYEILGFMKIKIDTEICRLNNGDAICGHIVSENILNTPVHRRTAEIFRKAFSVLENYNIFFGEESDFRYVSLKK